MVLKKKDIGPVNDSWTKSADIADYKYRATHTIVWLFDQSSCHKKFDELALQASKILVKDGGRRRVRDTVWAGSVQKMVNEDDFAKGLRTILQERGINTQTMKADDMRTVLSFHEDFMTENTIVEQYLKDRPGAIKRIFRPSSTVN